MCDLLRDLPCPTETKCGIPLTKDGLFLVGKVGIVLKGESEATLTLPVLPFPLSCSRPLPPSSQAGTEEQSHNKKEWKCLPSWEEKEEEISCREEAGYCTWSLEALLLISC